MWPDAISSLIIRVICSQLEWTDDEGKPLTTPRRVTVYRELRPTLVQAFDALWLELDRERTDSEPLFPRFKIDQTWLKVWALQQITGTEFMLGVVKAIEAGTPPSKVIDGIELQVVAEWRSAWQSPDAMLRLVAKQTYSSATKAAVLAELARRKAARKAKKAS